MPDLAGRRDYDLLFNNIGDALVSVDLSGRVMAANPSYYRLIGSTREAAPRSLPELYLNRREFDDRIMKLTSAAPSTTSRATSVAPTARSATSSRPPGPTAARPASITGYTCQLRDVTYLRNLEQRLEISERNYLLLFDTILSSIVIVDPEGRVLNWNYGAEQMYGHKWDDVVGRAFDEIFGVAADRPALPSIMATIAENGGRFVETGVPRTCRDGTVRFVYAAYAELRNSLERAPRLLDHGARPHRQRAPRAEAQGVLRADQGDPVRDDPRVRPAHRVPRQGHGAPPRRASATTRASWRPT